MDYRKTRRDQGSNLDRMPASPTTTVCDTTTTTLPPTGSTTRPSKDPPAQELFLHRLQKSNRYQRNNTELPPSIYNVPIYSSQNSPRHFGQSKRTLETNNSKLSKNRHPYQREAESRPINQVRKINTTEKAMDVSQSESRRNDKGNIESIGQNEHESNDPYSDFHGKEFFTDRGKKFNQASRNDSGRIVEFETADMKPFLEEEEQDMTSYRSDVMRGLGSKSNVAEEVRLRINSRERQRMHDLNTALDSLRQVMPYSSGPAVKKLSKMSTLLLARNYIVMLTRSLEEMKRLVTELSTNARPKPIHTAPLLPDPAYIASILASNPNPLVGATGLYLPPPPPLPPPPQSVTNLHRISPLPSSHCRSSTGAPNCACVECQRKSLLTTSAFLESKNSP